MISTQNHYLLFQSIKTPRLLVIVQSWGSIPQCTDVVWKRRYHPNVLKVTHLCGTSVQCHLEDTLTTSTRAYSGILKVHLGTFFLMRLFCAHSFWMNRLNIQRPSDAHGCEEWPTDKSSVAASFLARCSPHTSIPTSQTVLMFSEEIELWCSFGLYGAFAL